MSEWVSCDDCVEVYNLWNQVRCRNYRCKERCCPWCMYCSSDCRENEELKENLFDLLKLDRKKKSLLEEHTFKKTKEELQKIIGLYQRSESYRKKVDSYFLQNQSLHKFHCPKCRFSARNRENLQLHLDSDCVIV